MSVTKSKHAAVRPNLAPLPCEATQRMSLLMVFAARFEHKQQLQDEDISGLELDFEG
jgi:hypothetical protein